MTHHLNRIPGTAHCISWLRKWSANTMNISSIVTALVQQCPSPTIRVTQPIPDGTYNFTVVELTTGYESLVSYHPYQPLDEALVYPIIKVRRGMTYSAAVHQIVRWVEEEPFIGYSYIHPCPVRVRDLQRINNETKAIASRR